MAEPLTGICIGRGVPLRGDKDASPFGPCFLNAEQETDSLPHLHHHEGLSFLILHHLAMLPRLSQHSWLLWLTFLNFSGPRAVRQTLVCGFLSLVEGSLDPTVT